MEFGVILVSDFLSFKYFVVFLIFLEILNYLIGNDDDDDVEMLDVFLFC